jgi:hypothetical protein
MSSNKIFGAREDAEFHAHRIDITTGVITITIIVAVAHITAADRVGRFRAETVRPTEDTGYFRDGKLPEPQRLRRRKQRPCFIVWPTGLWSISGIVNGANN